MNLTDLHFLELQIDALFTHDARGRIGSTNEPGGDRAPRFFFGRTRAGNRWRFRDDLDEDTVRALDGLAATEPVHDDLRAEPRNLAAFLAVLGVDRGDASMHFGPAFRFPDVVPMPTNVTRVAHADLRLLQRLGWNMEVETRDFARREPYFAVIDDGAAVAVCFSARLTARAAEAGVETLEGYRGRGYAPAVVAAWACAIRASGRVPLYSTSWDNLASQAVARKRGLIQYATDLSIG
jgi:hypothetical protein